MHWKSNLYLNILNRRAMASPKKIRPYATQRSATHRGQKSSLSNTNSSSCQQNIIDQSATSAATGPHHNQSHAGSPHSQYTSYTGANQSGNTSSSSSSISSSSSSINRLSNSNLNTSSQSISHSSRSQSPAILCTVFVEALGWGMQVSQLNPALRLIYEILFQLIIQSNKPVLYHHKHVITWQIPAHTQ